MFSFWPKKLTLWARETISNNESVTSKLEHYPNNILSQKYCYMDKAIKIDNFITSILDPHANGIYKEV
jgi:hypothetical protein